MIKDGGLSFETQLKIEFLPLNNDIRKCLEKYLHQCIYKYTFVFGETYLFVFFNKHVSVIFISYLFRYYFLCT